MSKRKGSLAISLAAANVPNSLFMAAGEALQPEGVRAYVLQE